MGDMHAKSPGLASRLDFRATCLCKQDLSLRQSMHMQQTERQKDADGQAAVMKMSISCSTQRAWQPVRQDPLISISRQPWLLDGFDPEQQGTSDIAPTDHHPKRYTINHVPKEAHHCFLMPPSFSSPTHGFFVQVACGKARKAASLTPAIKCTTLSSSLCMQTTHS